MRVNMRDVLHICPFLFCTCMLSIDFIVKIYIIVCKSDKNVALHLHLLILE